MEFIVAPNLSASCDVAGLGCVNAAQDADAFAMFGILADGDIDAIFVEHRCGVDLTRAFSRWVFEFLPIRRVAVVFPSGFEERAVALFYRLRIESVTPAVTAAKKDKLAAVDHRQRR